MRDTTAQRRDGPGRGGPAGIGSCGVRRIARRKGALGRGGSGVRGGAFGQPCLGPVASGPASPRQTAPGQTNPGHVTPGQTIHDQASPGSVTPGQTSPGYGGVRGCLPRRRVQAVQHHPVQAPSGAQPRQHMRHHRLGLRDRGAQQLAQQRDHQRLPRVTRPAIPGASVAGPPGVPRVVHAPLRVVVSAPDDLLYSLYRQRLHISFRLQSIGSILTGPSWIEQPEVWKFCRLGVGHPGIPM